MKREILCQECFPTIQEICKDIEVKYNEFWKYIKGYALRDFRCDQCGKLLPENSLCYAVSIWSGRGRNQYFSWESSYIEED